MFAEINSASFFIDLLALSLVLVPPVYFIKCNVFRETALTLSGAALIIVPASPRYSAGLKMLCFRGLCRFVAGRDGSFM